MPDLSPYLGGAAVAVIAVFLVWFALGTQRNIRIGNDVLRWLQDGLPVLGPRTTLRWLGSSVVELKIAEASEPFRDATILVVLEPRDIGFLWAWARLRGRRDFVIVRANLREPPRIDVDAWDARAWTGRPAGAAEDGRPIAWPGTQVEARVAGDGDPAAIRTTWSALARATPGVWRLSVQPVVPHIEAHLLVPDRRGASSRGVLEPIRDLARALRSR
jgi:hypothetical protein